MLLLESILILDILFKEISMKVKILIAVLMSSMLAISSACADSSDMDALTQPTDPMQLADNGMSGTSSSTNNSSDNSMNDNSSNGASSGSSANTMSGVSAPDDGSP